MASMHLKFENNKDIKYPTIITFWQKKLEKQMCKSISFRERQTMLFPIYFLKMEDSREVFIKLEDHTILISYDGVSEGYLLCNMIDLVINETIESGGIVSFPQFGDKYQNFPINKDNVKEVYEFLNLNYEDRIWFLQPYHIAKEMEGFRL